MTAYGRIRDVNGTSRPVSAEGADYDTASAAVRAQVGEGEILLSISAWPV